jgi:hypothetical protein
MKKANQCILRQKSGRDFTDIRVIQSEDKSIKFNRDKKYPNLDVFDACKAEGLVFTGNSFYLN